MRVPIACTLSAGDAATRIDEWQAAYALIDEVQVDGRVVRLRLQDNPEALLQVLDLAEREKQCCAFFDFSIDLDGARRWLRIAVPEDAADILTGFVASLTAGSDRQ